MTAALHSQEMAQIMTRPPSHLSGTYTRMLFEENMKKYWVLTTFCVVFVLFFVSALLFRSCVNPHSKKVEKKNTNQSKLKAFRNLSSVTVHIHTNPVREVIHLTNSLNYRNTNPNFQT